MTLQKNAELPLGLKYDDLPLWMRRTRREIDWAFLVMVVVSLVVVWPFLVRTGSPYNTGTQLEISRTLEMSESIQAGILYPRWAPDFDYGYGSPLWNYLAPLPHYLTGLHHVLVQSNPASSVKVIFALALGLGGLGMFSFVRRRCGTYAGILASAVYLYSPQIALVKPYLEGDLGGLLALGLFLLALWAFDRVLAGERGWDMVLSTLILAGLWVSQTPLNLILVGLLAGWLVWRALIGSPPPFRWWRAWLAVGLGTGISAFFWLPALVERSAVYWQSLSDYSSQAWLPLSPGEMLSQPSRLDFSAVNPAQTAAIGVAVWGLAGAALAAVWVWNWRRTPPDRRPVSRGEATQSRVIGLFRQMPSQQREMIYFAAVGSILFGSVTPPAASLWRRLPPWPPLYLHDLLPVIVACWAVVVAQLGYLAEQNRRRRIGVGVVVFCLGMILVLAFPTLPLPSWPDTRSESTLLSVLREETRGHMVASQVTGWLLPRTVHESPQPSPALMASYQAGVVDKVARDRLPPSVRVDVVEQGPQTQHLIVRSAGGPAVLTLLILDFPGWRASVDGKSAALHPDATTGWLTLIVPEGQHDIVIDLGSTPIRDVAWVVSGLAALFTLLVSIYEETRMSSRRAAAGQGKMSLRVAEAPHMGLLLAVLLLSIGGSAPRVAANLFAFHSPPGVVETQKQLPRALQGGVDLLAYDIEKPARLHAGDDFTLSLYWRASRPDLPDYQVNLSLTAQNDSQNPAMVIQRRHPGLIPSSQWSIWPLLDYYVRDSYYLRLDKNALPGEYNIVIQLGSCSQFTLLPCKSIDPLFVRDGRGSSQGQRIVLPVTIEVVR